MSEEAGMGPGWVKIWTAANGDAVFLNGEKALVRFDFGERCASHEDGSLCMGCILRAEKALQAARHILVGKKPPA